MKTKIEVTINAEFDHENQEEMFLILLSNFLRDKSKVNKIEYSIEGEDNL